MVKHTPLSFPLLSVLERPIEEPVEQNTWENSSSTSTHTSSDTIDISTLLRSSHNEIEFQFDQDTLNVSELPLQSSVIARTSRVTFNVKKSVQNAKNYMAEQKAKKAKYEKAKMQTTIIDTEIIKDNDKGEEKMVTYSEDSLDFKENYSTVLIDLEDSESNAFKQEISSHENTDVEQGEQYLNLQPRSTIGPCNREMEVNANQNEVESIERFPEKANARLEDQEDNKTGIELFNESNEMEFLCKFLYRFLFYLLIIITTLLF
jgi:hypothetical protein